MKLFDEFSKRAPNRVFFSILLGALSGVFAALLIPIVLNAINNDAGRFTEVELVNRYFLGFEVANYQFAALFFFACVFILCARSFSQIALIRISLDLTTSLRISVYNRVINSSIPALEKLGPSRIIATITEDVRRIIMGAQMLPDLIINVVTVLGMLSFLLYLNSDVFLFVLGAIVFGIVTYQIPVYFGNKAMNHSRVTFDKLQESIRGLLYGTKELKLNKAKRDDYFGNILLSHENEVKCADKKALTLVRMAINYGDLLSFYIIGVVTFIFVNYHSVSSNEMLGVVMALLYLTGPVAAILNCSPQLIMAKISLNKLNQLLEEIPTENANEDVFSIAPWDSIVFKDVTYRHTSAVDKSANDVTATEQETFAVGPMSFEIKRGEVTFIVGGNGSGKSTLSKVITQHYIPDSGSVNFGETVLDQHNLNSCRNEVSAIFSDYYLFDRLLGVNVDGSAQLVNEYLEYLELDKKVEVSKGHFSTLKLSDGQRKRLALLVSFIEDKSLYVFDEWAADQDPVFKKVFYEKILPDLKAKNKAIVVISHDDRYFSIADKLLIMEDGQLIKTQMNDRNKVTHFHRNNIDELTPTLDMV